MMISIKPVSNELETYENIFPLYCLMIEIKKPIKLTNFRQIV